MGLVVQNI
jgi:hypothetical protein